jgi:DNA primase
MGKYFTRGYLYRIRNEIPVLSLLKRLAWPNKYREGEFFTLCPCCHEFMVKKTPEANLGHCFGCDRNFNTIDFTMLIEQVDFVIAIEILDPLLPPSSSR